MARLTFLGKPLKRDGRRNGHPTYMNANAAVHWNNHLSLWVAQCNIHCVWNRPYGADTPQEALNDCEAVTIEQFRKLGARLGYEVE